MPKLPVSAARNTFSDTSTTADPTEPSAASFFSRVPRARSSGIVRAIIRSASRPTYLSRGSPYLSGGSLLYEVSCEVNRGNGLVCSFQQSHDFFGRQRTVHDA